MTTFIDTTACERVSLGDLEGDVAEIVNRQLCGAEDVVAMLRWLNEGEQFNAEPLEKTHQLLYLMKGDGVISLNGEEYKVNTGAGVYLGPTETAGIRHAGSSELKLLHLVVPEIEGR